jgi:predicted dehydrogenase
MNTKKEVLIIGCGKIGALSDFKKGRVTTHLKAFVLSNGFKVSVYDEDLELATKVASHYNIEKLFFINEIELSKFQIIVISTPTPSHFLYLKMCMRLNTRVIICEKPITDSIKELRSVKRLRQYSKSKILINYFRRFHPSYSLLKNKIAEIADPLLNIQVTYQRGFLNNATHALDLLHYILGEKKLRNIKICSYIFDEFKNDPTLSLHATYGSVPIVFQGLQNVKFSYFEVRFWFERKCVIIESNGESVRFLTADEKGEKEYYPSLRLESNDFYKINAIENAFKYIVASAEVYLKNRRMKDNFESSFSINYQSLKIIENICQN